MITAKEFDRLKEVITDAVPFRDLSPFERQFVADFAGKIARYGTRISLTEKQWEIVDQIERKIYHVG